MHNASAEQAVALGAVALQEFVEDDVAPEECAADIARIRAAPVEDLLIVAEGRRALFQREVVLREVELHSASERSEIVVEVTANGELVAVGDEGRRAETKAVSSVEREERRDHRVRLDDELGFVLPSGDIERALAEQESFTKQRVRERR